MYNANRKALNLQRPNKHNHNPASPRMTFQWNCVDLPGVQDVLNVGCSDDPLRFKDRATHFDLDDWTEYYDESNLEFHQGDVHHLTSYFPENSFDLVLLGDVVEHLVEPGVALLECMRVTRKYVAFTIWEEWRLPSPGRHIDIAREQHCQVAQAAGYETPEELYEHTWSGVKVFSDIETPHWGHIWRFNESLVQDLLATLVANGATILFYEKELEIVHEGHPAYNWLILLET